MKFGIKKNDDGTYEWHLYEHSTQNSNQTYFPQSRAHFNFDKKIKISMKDDILISLLQIDDINGSFDQLSYILLNNIDNFIAEKAPFHFEEEYFIDQCEESLKFRKIPIKKLINDELPDSLENSEFHSETKLLEEGDEKEKDIYIFINNHMIHK